MTTAIITALLLKHFVCDFPLQAFPWMYRNKGTYGHPGGIAHAAVHVVGTLLALGFCGVGFWISLAAAVADGIVHYHIDWAKMRIGAWKNWGPTNSEYFWMLLGIDQLLHQLTYIAIAVAIGAP
jgi:hypothetical protein